MGQSKAAGRALGTVRRVALTSLGAGLAVGAAAPLASAATIADTVPDASAPLSAAALPAQAATAAEGAVSEGAVAQGAVAGAGWQRLGQVKLYPLAGTGLDPLSNVVGTSLGGIPVSTAPVSQMVEDGLPVGDLPVVGGLLSPS
jgi:hypothetical protein